MSNKALLIANGTFPEKSGLPILNGPRHDIAAMRAALSHSEYGLFKDEDIVCCPEFDQASLRRAIEEFLRDTSREDFVLIYYSGHGLRPGTRLYFAASDTEEGKTSTALSTGTIIELLDEVNRAERTMFILDCCYAAGAFDKGSAADVLEESLPGTWSLCSSPSTQTSKDGKEGEPSQFTKALTETLVDPGLGPDDDLGRLHLDSVYKHIARTLRPRPVISVKAQGPAPIAQRVLVGGAGGVPAYPELDMLRDQDLEIVQEVSMTAQDTAVMRHLSALLDLAGQPESPHHRETVDTVRSFVGEFLRRSGKTDEVLAGVRLSATRLTRLSLRIPDSSGAQLPWEYLELGEPRPGIPYGLPALGKNLIIERRARRARPDTPPQPPPDGDKVGKVMLIGSPTGEVPVAGEKALRQDLANLKIEVDPPEADRGLTYGELTFRSEWPPVVVVLAGVRRITRITAGHPVFRAEIQLGESSGESWIDAQKICDEFWFAGDDGRTPFRAIIIETFATTPGNDAQGATAEIASSLAGLGLGNVIFLCHPPGFDGYERCVGGHPIRTFAGHLIGALNAGAMVPRAFYVARSRMQSAFLERCEQTFGIPGLYIPEYTQPPTSRTVGRRPEQAAGPAAGQSVRDQPPRRGDRMEPSAPASSLSRTNINPQQPDSTALKKMAEIADKQGRGAGGSSPRDPDDNGS